MLGGLSYYRDFLARQNPSFSAQRLYVMGDQLPRLALQLLTHWMRRLPDVQLLGAQKAGTTTLYSMLMQHPDVVGGLSKESHFLDGRSVFGDVAGEPPRSLRWMYRSFFPSVLTHWSHRVTHGRGVRVVDATPVTVMLEAAPRQLWSLNRDARLIAVLREPIGRAWSHYGMNRRWGRESLSMADALAAEDELWSSSRPRSEVHWNRSYIRRGLYATQLRRFRDAGFTDEQLLLVAFEDLQADPQGVADRLFAFLGLSPHRVDATPKNAAPKRGALPDVAAVNAVLRKRFASENAALVDEFGFQVARAWSER